jgi:hypothetical protein
MNNQTNEPVIDYWAQHYVNEKAGVCALCGNSGVIDTTNAAVSPTGVKVGGRMPCICPNGQWERAHGLPIKF